MKVKDIFPYFSAKTPILVTEGVGKVLFDGDRNEMPEELEKLDATRFEFLFHERKFWVSVYELPEIKIDKDKLSDDATSFMEIAGLEYKRRALVSALVLKMIQEKTKGENEEE